MSEEELQNELLGKLEGIGSDYRESIQIGKEVPIIKDCTFLPKDQFNLYLGHTDTDICIFIKQNDLSDHLNESDTFKLFQTSDNEINVPLAIIETKRNHITTDDIRSRSIIAREINEIFPFCAYFFVADKIDGVSSDKVRRAGKHFSDFFLSDGQYTDEMTDRVAEYTRIHLNQLEDKKIIEKKVAKSRK